MNYRASTPTDVAPLVRPGDVVAFSGRGVVSDIVRTATQSHISHIGMVLSADPAAQMIESTSLDGFCGVTIGSFLARCSAYSGDVWWYPLSALNRAKCRSADLHAWILAQDHKEYDTWGAVGSALHEHVLQNPNKWFCSELGAAILQHGGVLPPAVDPALVRPCDLLQFPIFADSCYQIGWMPS